jgi:hypothetical protein
MGFIKTNTRRPDAKSSLLIFFSGKKVLADTNSFYPKSLLFKKILCIFVVILPQ